MRAAKVVVFVIATLAMVGSMGSVVAQPAEEHNDEGSSGWSVTCQYNQFEQLISKTCTSGGTHACKCP